MPVSGSNIVYLHSWPSLSGEFAYVRSKSIGVDRVSENVFQMPILNFNLIYNLKM